jgi:hypothetical protein
METSLKQAVSSVAAVFPFLKCHGEVESANTYFMLVCMGIRALCSSVSWFHHFFRSHMPSNHN